MIGALVTLLSLDVTKRLILGGVVASSLVVVGASNTSPIVVQTSADHGFIRPQHALIDGVNGNTAANGMWVCTPTGADTLALTSYDRQGTPVTSTGSGAYGGGGTLKTAFPDGSILLGRRNVAMQMAVVSPRIVFVPLGSPEWGLDPYGGVIPPIAQLPTRRSEETAEQQTMKQARQLATERQRFEVHVSAAATPPDPDFGDFDVTQAVYQTLFASMFDLITPARAKVLKGEWTSQSLDVQQFDTRGQKWVGIVEIAQPVTDRPLSFVPSGTVGTIKVNFYQGSSADETVLIVPTVP